MVGEASTESTSRHLSLALFARQAIEALLDFLEEGQREGLHESLEEAIESLTAATDRNRAPTSRYAKAFRGYVEVLTLDEVLPDKEQRQEIIQTLNNLLRATPGPVEEQQQQAQKALAFFYTLENRALRNFGHASRQPSVF